MGRCPLWSQLSDGADGSRLGARTRAAGLLVSLLSNPADAAGGKVWKKSSEAVDVTESRFAITHHKQGIHEMETTSTYAGYRPHPDVIVQRMGEEVMLLHLESNRFFELNRTAARLWELLASGCNRAQLEQQMLQEFEVDPTQLAREIDGLLATLSAQELISPHENS